MAKKRTSDEGLTLQRGPYYRVTGDGSGIEVKLDAINGAAPTYSASWLALLEVAGVPHLCFGQKLGRVLGSRVDVRFGIENLLVTVQNSQDFIERLFEHVEAADDASWALDNDYPANLDKYLLEDANVAVISYSGTLAELEFYTVPARDIHAVRLQRAGVQYRGPRPILTVVLTVAQLRWLLEAIIRYLAHREEAP